MIDCSKCYYQNQCEYGHSSAAQDKDKCPMKGGNGRWNIAEEKPIAYLVHEPTRCLVGVYKPIGWFKRLMLKWCLGLEYKKN